MKRSEMKEIIENVIDDLLLEGAFGTVTSPNDPTRENSIKADIRFGDVEGRILDAIEKAGMLPPRLKGAYQLWGFNPYIENNYWEPEK